MQNCAADPPTHGDRAPFSRFCKNRTNEKEHFPMADIFDLFKKIEKKENEIFLQKGKQGLRVVLDDNSISELIK